MRRTLITGAAAIALLASSQAMAQTVVIAPEQRTKIKEYVVKERVKPVIVKERLAVGVTVPADVELAPVPEIWGVPAIRSHRYFYSDGHIVLVEPSSRRVIEVIE